MPNYQHSKIYTIRCKTNVGLIYVGSTTRPLYERWCEHKRAMSNEIYKNYNTRLYQMMREIGHDNFYIELYKEYPCDNIEQLHKEEGEVIRNIGTLNINIAGRNKFGWYKDNKEHCLLQEQIRRKTSEKCKESKQKYNETHKEEIKVYNKQYRESGKKKEKDKEHYDKMKKIMIECECGRMIPKPSITRHKKSQNHLLKIT